MIPFLFPLPFAFAKAKEKQRKVDSDVLYSDTDSIITNKKKLYNNGKYLGLTFAFAFCLCKSKGKAKVKDELNG